LTAQPAAASTVQEIVARGTVRIGVLTGAPPYGTVDERGNPAGYDVDVANLVATYLGVRAELVPLTPPARIPALQAGRVDFLVSTLAPTPTRAQTVMFTMPYNAFQMVILSNRRATYARIGDLAGKRVGVNRGSSQETALQRENIPGLTIVRYEDDSTVMQALIAGQIDAAAIPDVIARDLIRQRPNLDLAIKFVFFQQPNSMAVRLDDFNLHQWLNNAIYSMKVSGDLNRIAERWTGAPLPELPVF